MSSQLQKNLLLLDNTLHSKAKWKTNRQISDFAADNLTNIEQEPLLPMQPQNVRPLLLDRALACQATILEFMC